MTAVVAYHPQTPHRIAAISAAAAALRKPSQPLLAPPERAALQRICG